MECDPSFGKKKCTIDRIYDFLGTLSEHFNCMKNSFNSKSFAWILSDFFNFTYNLSSFVVMKNLVISKQKNIYIYISLWILCN